MPDLADVELSKKRGGAAAAEEGFSVEDIMKLLLWLTLFTIALIELIFLVILAGKVGTLENQVTGKLDTSALSVASLLGTQELDLKNSNVKVSQGSLTLMSSAPATATTKKATITYDGADLKFSAGGKDVKIGASGITGLMANKKMFEAGPEPVNISSTDDTTIEGKNVKIKATGTLTFEGTGKPASTAAANTFTEPQSVTGSGHGVTIADGDIVSTAATRKLTFTNGGIVEAGANNLALTAEAGNVVVTATGATSDLQLVGGQHIQGTATKKVALTAVTGVELKTTGAASHVTLNAHHANGTLKLQNGGNAIATVAAGGLTIAAGKAFIYGSAPRVVGTATTDTTLADCGNTLYLNKAGVVVTLKAGEVASPVGCTIRFVQMIDGNFTITRDGAETITSGVVSVAQVGARDGAGTLDFAGLAAGNSITVDNVKKGNKAGGTCVATKNAAAQWTMECALRGVNAGAATLTPVV